MKLLEIILPEFYQQETEPKNANKYSVWQCSSNNKIYVLVDRWREIQILHIDETEETNKYEVSKKDYNFLKEFKRWIDEIN